MILGVIFLSVFLLLCLSVLCPFLKRIQVYLFTFWLSCGHIACLTQEKQHTIAGKRPELWPGNYSLRHGATFC